LHQCETWKLPLNVAVVLGHVSGHDMLAKVQKSTNGSTGVFEGAKQTQLIGAEVGNFSCKDGPRVTRRGIDPLRFLFPLYLLVFYEPLLL
jgi:hypothetical protein